MEWSDRLSIGVASIDMQHQELVLRVNKLLSAMQASQGTAEVSRLVAFLGDYVVSHFGNEERLMEKQAYPKRAEHQTIHAAFMKELGQLRGDLERGGASPALAVALNRKLGDWLVNHIMGVDKALGAFLAARKAA